MPQFVRLTVQARRPEVLPVWRLRANQARHRAAEAGMQVPLMLHSCSIYSFRVKYLPQKIHIAVVHLQENVQGYKVCQMSQENPA